VALKVVLLEKRAPTLDLTAFHGALLEAARNSVPSQGCRRYVQSQTLPQGYRRGELPFDAVEEMWFDDRSDALAWLHLAGRDMARLVPGTSGLTLLVNSHLMKDDPVPAGAIKSIELVTRRPGMSTGPFRCYWREVHGPLGAGIPGMLRYEQNHADDALYEMVEPPLDGLAITWFASTAVMRDATLSPVYADTRADEANFLPDGHLPVILTREVVDTGPM
jgi:uncharacterized protein (TIGR02118 family)